MRSRRAPFTLSAPQTARLAAAAATLSDPDSRYHFTLTVGSKLSIRRMSFFSDALVAAIIEGALRECRAKKRGAPFFDLVQR